MRALALSGVENKVIAVMPCTKTTDGSYAIWERQGLRDRYVVGAVNPSGKKDGELWYSGNYTNNYDRALLYLLERSGHATLAETQKLIMGE